MSSAVDIIHPMVKVAATVVAIMRKGHRSGEDVPTLMSFVCVCAYVSPVCNAQYVFSGKQLNSVLLT